MLEFDPYAAKHNLLVSHHLYVLRKHNTCIVSRFGILEYNGNYTNNLFIIVHYIYTFTILCAIYKFLLIFTLKHKLNNMFTNYMYKRV